MDDERQIANEPLGRERAVRPRTAVAAAPAAAAPDDEVGVLVLVAGRVAAGNEALCTLLGYERDELLGLDERRVVEAAVHGAGRPTEGTGLARLRRHDQSTIVAAYEVRELYLRASQGQVWLIRRVLDGGPSGQASPHSLTLREQQILQLVADGFENDRIAAALVISPETVKTHIRRVLHKLGARSRTHAVAIAFRASLVE